MTKPGLKLPAMVFALGVSLAMALWWGLRIQYDLAFQAGLDKEAATLAMAAQTVMADRLNSLQRMRAHWASSGPARRAVWQSEAHAILVDLPGTQATEWSDPDGIIRWVEPLAGNERALGVNLNTEGVRRRTVERAKVSRAPTATPLLALKQGGKGFLLFVPLFSGDQFDGMLVTVFRAEQFVPHLFPQQTFEQLQVHIREGTQTVFGPGGAWPKYAPVARAPIRFAGLEWTLEVSPREAYLARKTSVVPEACLAVGIVLSFLIAWLVHMTQLARAAAQGMRQANLALRDSLRRVEETNAELAFRQYALDQAAIVAITDVDGCILYANDKFCEISGYSREELLGQTHDLIKSKYHPAEFFDEMYRVIGKGGVWRAQVRNLKRNGDDYWVDTTIIPSVGRDGKVDRYVAIRFDVSEQKHVEETLRRVLTLQAAILDNAGFAIIATDARGTITAFNHAAERMLGYAAEEMIGYLTPSVFHDTAELEAHAARVSAAMGEPVAPGLPAFIAQNRLEAVFEAEWTYVRKDCSRFPVILSVSALNDASGSFCGLLGLAVDISERKRAEEELRRHRDHLSELVREQTADIVQAKENAERASHAKSEFLANMSHELRTPMHAILSFARLGKERSNAQAPERLREYFDRIAVSGERLLVMINDLLDLSKLDAGKMRMELQPTDLLGLCREVAADLDGLATAKGLTLDVVTPAGATRTMVDPLRMAQVVRNLLSNAIKFSPENRRIEIRLAEAERDFGAEGVVKGLSFAVSDDGFGIPEDELEIIFEKFMQSSKTRSGSGGTGLGLAICRDIVQAHGGRICARNRPEGGACLEVWLPRVEHEPA